MMRIQRVTQTILAATLMSLSFVAFSSAASGKDVAVSETINTPELNAADNVPPRVKKKDLSSITVKSGEQLRTATHSVDYWFYDATVTLYNDRDYDGYYASFDLEFDADSTYYRTPVYAIVYLGTNDYYEAFHVTSVFNLYADSSDDSVLLESELVTGYPSNDYDILIELIDAQTDQVLATIDAYEDADLSYQSMESFDYDRPVTSEVVIETHGGSWGVWTSIIVVLTILLRRTSVRRLRPEN
ncbi:choice-of-anchor H family protein [Alteromonas lipolytica]|uniref:GlyGly-CTERM sorting domain-containing protein n=1 Tax=Alteromonas lipolytica TaxID=1856405 RepID=A0A1E8FAY5_9ALTE|nr:choice-of-anchor H family protein [Alteromonas lipolytica]OFI32768.1 hypothetical protein BFC17_06350 [Alteromonas lipolytica]GGF73229.1 hypothetical protein GCM10011338_26740 [Alteromonas lipolytica]